MSDKGPLASVRRPPGSNPPQAAEAEPCLYRLIAESSAGWECLEDPDGRMLWVSPSCEPITGHTPDDFLKDPGLLLAIVHPEDRPLLESHQRECRLSGDRDEAEFRVVRPDGGVCWIAHRCQPMSLPGGTSVGRRSSNREITRRKEAEGKLLTQNRTLRESERRLSELNETLERRVAERTAEAERRATQLQALAFELSQAERSERLVLANAIHDHLQQILVAAKLNLDALQARFGDEKLRSDLLRVGQLLDDSLTWCRSVTVSLSPPVLQEAGLAGGLGWLARQMQERQGLQVNLSVCDDWVEPPDADLNAFLFEAVRELLFNVVRHSGERAAHVTLRREDGTFEIRVDDDGKGFDPRILRERAQERARFGLFSIQQRLEMIGGSMSVESSPGHGTRVTLRVLAIPVPPKAEAVTEQPAGAVRKEAPGQATARSGRVRVVIADDHPIFRQGFGALLRAEGWIDVVGEAADGAEAVELARTLRPDVIVMDVSMPKMSGIEATRQIVAELPGVRVVGLSMHEDEEIAASMREAGAVEFVTKGGLSDTAISAIYAAHFGGKKS